MIASIAKLGGANPDVPPDPQILDIRLATVESAQVRAIEPIQSHGA